jgi:hypothetical protein
MSNEPITLANAFDVEQEAAKRANEVKQSSSFKEVKQKIAEQSGGMKLAPGFYDGLFDLLIENVNELLGIDIPADILAGTWKKQQMLAGYRDKEKYPPDRSYPVTMVDHTIKTSHEPSMEISLFEQTVCTLTVKFEATFLIKGLILDVQDGKIKKMRTGDIESTGQMQFVGVPVMETKKIIISIPGVYDLKEGVEIPDPFGQKRPS